jgi:hypothetical protein
MKWRLPSPSRFAASLRMALLLLALAATGVQQLVAQTHWHAMPAVHASVAAPADDSGTQAHDDCLLCRIASHAGIAAPPPAAGLFAVRHDPVSAVASYHEADVPALPAHAWQSRGPPAA